MKKLTLRSGLMATTTICNAVLPALAGTAVLAAGAALLMPSAAIAQSAVGSVNGTTEAGASVTITDTETGVTNTTSADARGAFNFAALPPGTYTVTAANGTTETVEVKAGLGTTVSLSAASQEIVIRSSRSINPIDVKSVESTSIFTASQMDALPVGREISDVALLAPGTVKSGHPNFDNLVSVGGSSVAENGYYINGFDVTNLRNLISYADLPFDGVAQAQIKTGGYGAEFGRSLGGVLSVVTKRGTNKWKFGGSVEFEPADLKKRARNIISKDPDDVGSSNPLDYHYHVYASEDTSESMKWTNYISGPIIEDKLFVFAMVQGKKVVADVYNRETSYHSEDTSPMGLLKLDYYLTPDHHFEYTGIFNKNAVRYVDYQNPLDETTHEVTEIYTGEHHNRTAEYDTESGGQVDILKYTGHLTDTFTVSAMYGKLTNVADQNNPAVVDPDAALCPRAYDSRGNPGAVTYIGCWIDPAQTFIPDPNFAPDNDKREAIRIDAEWTLGDHNLRFGYDDEKFTSTHRGEVYTGGIYWRFFDVPVGSTPGGAGRTVNGVIVPEGSLYARSWDNRTGSSSFEVLNSAMYVEDSWQITPNLMLYGGLRSESFTNKNGDGKAFVEAENLIAPRLGFSWDVGGAGDTKLSASLGRYYIPVATNTNIRASGVEYRIEEYFYITGVDTAMGTPIGLGAQIGPENLNGSMTAPAPASVASATLEPMYQDELIVAAQKRLNDNLTMGVRTIYRQVGNGMDDHCSVQPFQSWADDNGFGSTIDLDTIAPCHIINPGKDVSLEFDADGDGVAELNKVDAEYFGFPEYKRNYWSIELFGDARGTNWSVNGSYTLSFSRGNVEGYVNTSLGQIDAGLTQDWDNFLFARGSSGWLPNDRRHSLKLFGNYRLNEEIQFGANLLVQSGRPINCLGFLDLADAGIDAGQLAAYSASSFYCADATNTRTLKNRGSAGRTDWNTFFDAMVEYKPEWAGGHVTFQAVAFNLFNIQGITRVTEESQKGSASTPLYNPNFLNAAAYQSPRSVRFTMRYNF